MTVNEIKQMFISAINYLYQEGDYVGAITITKYMVRKLGYSRQVGELIMLHNPI